MRSLRKWELSRDSGFGALEDLAKALFLRLRYLALIVVVLIDGFAAGPLFGFHLPKTLNRSTCVKTILMVYLLSRGEMLANKRPIKTETPQQGVQDIYLQGPGMKSNVARPAQRSQRDQGLGGVLAAGLISTTSA